MGSGNSRDADKFVIRFPDGMRARVNEASQVGFWSMNNYVIIAILEKLDRDERAKLALDALVEAAKRAEAEQPK